MGKLIGKGTIFFPGPRFRSARMDRQKLHTPSTQGQQASMLPVFSRTGLAVVPRNGAVDAAQEEAKRKGLDDRIRFYHGDFVDLASEIPPADIVTLDRVICCYPDISVGRFTTDEEIDQALDRLALVVQKLEQST